MPLTDAAQAVQVSAFRDRYAQWEKQAADLVCRITTPARTPTRADGRQERTSAASSLNSVASSARSSPSSRSAAARSARASAAE